MKKIKFTWIDYIFFPVTIFFLISLFTSALGTWKNTLFNLLIFSFCIELIVIRRKRMKYKKDNKAFKEENLTINNKRGLNG